MRRTRRRKNGFLGKIVFGTGVLFTVCMIYILGSLAAGKEYLTETGEDGTTPAAQVEIESTAPEMENVTETDTTNIPMTETEEARTEEKQTDEVQTDEPGQSAEESERAAYFDHSLFIGDSRTMGLRDYADFGSADFFCGPGMSVYKVYTAKVITENAQKKTLEEMLSEKEYDTIYVMTGMNELGYNFAKSVERYQNFIEWLAEMEPQAEIVLEANLHVTKERSDTDEYFNNPNINRFNEEIQAWAEQTSRQYLDVNPLFDDENGNLSEAYAVDDSHILGKYYAQWADWIYEKRTNR